jgi:FlaA1/EpsC-like NDP-sugar epimerase
MHIQMNNNDVHPFQVLKANLVYKLVGLSRFTKKIILSTSDFVVLSALLIVVIYISRDTHGFNLVEMGFVVLLSMASLVLSGVYRSILRMFDEGLMRQVALYFMLLFFVGSFLIKNEILGGLFVPELLVYLCLSLFYIWYSRLFLKQLLSSEVPANNYGNVLIYGAGTAGKALLRYIQNKKEYHVVGFLDDSRSLKGGYISKVPVFDASLTPQVVTRNNVKSILLAMPSIGAKRKAEIYDFLESVEVKVLSVPTLSQIMSGNLNMTDLQEVRVEDILGRNTVEPIPELLYKNIKNKVVLVTGAGGSIGGELTRQVVKLSPKLLILYEISEYALYLIERELQDLTDITIIPIIGSVTDKLQVERLFEKFDIDTVYHAAAYKHVPLVETNPFMGVMNNTIGTAVCAMQAMKHQVETFVLISTDKAVRPTNIMGASKRLAELVCQGLAIESKTQFSMVRFGNVLGSSGSVVPLFKKQIEQGGPLTVTHPEITRYFMTIPEAALLVIQAGAMGTGGDVFLLDMGEPVKIVDLAKKMIRLSGRKVLGEEGAQAGIEIKYAGLRPGEKLYEELLISNEGSETTQHPLIMRSFEKQYPINVITNLLNEIEIAYKRDDVSWLISQIELYVDGYQRSHLYH